MYANLDQNGSGKAWQDAMPRGKQNTQKSNPKFNETDLRPKIAAFIVKTTTMSPIDSIIEVTEDPDDGVTDDPNDETTDYPDDVVTEDPEPISPSAPQNQGIAILSLDKVSPKPSQAPKTTNLLDMLGFKVSPCPLGQIQTGSTFDDGTPESTYNPLERHARSSQNGSTNHHTSKFLCKSMSHVKLVSTFCLINYIF